MTPKVNDNREVQQQSAATAPHDTDPIRPPKSSDLRQRPLTTSMRLVHTEEVTGSIPVSPTRSGGMSIFVGIAVGAIPVAKWSAGRYAACDDPAGVAGVKTVSTSITRGSA